MVFRDTGFDFSNKVSTDIGRFCINTTPYTGE